MLPLRILSMAALATGLVVTPGRAQQGREARFVDSLIGRMTLEEKLGQLVQAVGEDNPSNPVAPAGSDVDIRKGHVGSFLGVFGADYTRSLQKIAVEESRLHIPLLFAHDVIHGFRTIFPVPLAEAASWDTAGAAKAARIAATEATASGLMWTYAPMVDIARDPRWGRIVEGSGEDPYLGSVFAAARVRGFQSTTPKMMATAKHFVAYGAAEGGRDYNTAEVGERTLREVYLPPFQAAVQAGVKSVMAGFDALDGVPMHANGPLINGVLRHEWGWNGVVISDYTGVMELMKHEVAATPGDAGRLAIGAGVDIDMVSNIYFDALPAEIKAGRVTVLQVDQAVRRVLRAKYELGLFTNPYQYCDKAREDSLVLTPANRAAARQAAREAIVLLKNTNHTLPLAKTIKTLAVIGTLADDTGSAVGPWPGVGRPSDAISVLDGIRRAVSPDTRIVASAEGADAIILVLGEPRTMSGEATGQAHLDLPDDQLAIANTAVATGKPVVVVLMNGRPLTIAWLDQHASAIVEAWYLGTEMGPALADVLFGDYNPGGKLPVTFPRTVGQIPIYYDHEPTGRPPKAEEHYTSKYIDEPWTPLYPFGYGLSYTTFHYDSLHATIAHDTIMVSAQVTNTGDREGEEVVQLYTHQRVGSVSPPVKVLRRFVRVPFAPGEHRTITFALPVAELAIYGANIRRAVEPGVYDIFVGPSSADGPQTEVRVSRGSTVPERHQ